MVGDSWLDTVLSRMFDFAVLGHRVLQDAIGSVLFNFCPKGCDDAVCRDREG